MSSVDDPASANGPPAKVWLCFISVSKVFDGVFLDVACLVAL